jgi:hypothetical protein
MFVAALLNATTRTKAVYRGESLVFGATTFIRYSLPVIVGGFAVASVYGFIVSGQYIVPALIFGLIAIAGTFGIPSDIVVTKDAVKEIKWWRSTVIILWTEVKRIEHHKGPATTIVISNAGKRVTHSGWNRDTIQFLKICCEKARMNAIESQL